VDALANDKYGIALSGAGYRNPRVKLVAAGLDGYVHYFDKPRRVLDTRKCTK
jgi:hypothetical protein